MAPKFCYALRVATMILLRRASSVTEMVKRGQSHHGVNAVNFEMRGQPVPA